MASGAKFVAPPWGHPNEFIMRLVTFLGADFTDAVNDFLATNASRVTVVEEGEEHSLESYAVFQDYLQLVEGKMEAGTTPSNGVGPAGWDPGGSALALYSEAFMRIEGMSEDAFHAKCAACVEEDRAMNIYVTALVAGWEYHRFLDLVRDFTEDEAAMDVLEDVLRGHQDQGEDEDEDQLDDAEGSGARRGWEREDDFSAFT